MPGPSPYTVSQTGPPYQGPCETYRDGEVRGRPGEVDVETFPSFCQHVHSPCLRVAPCVEPFPSGDTSTGPTATTTACPSRAGSRVCTPEGRGWSGATWDPLSCVGSGSPRCTRPSSCLDRPQPKVRVNCAHTRSELVRRVSGDTEGEGFVLVVEVDRRAGGTVAGTVMPPEGPTETRQPGRSRGHWCGRAP